MNVTEYDFAKLSPVLAKERFIGNYQAAILGLAKRNMEQNASAILELMDSGPVAKTPAAPEASAIDIKL